MTQNKPITFTNLLHDTLIYSAIEYHRDQYADVYKVYNNHGTMFYVMLNKKNNNYYFHSTNLLKQECKKHKIPMPETIDTKDIYENVVFAYNIQDITKCIGNNIDALYTRTLTKSDIIFHNILGTETYTVVNSDVPVYTIARNQKNGEGMFFPHDLMYILYKICNISPTTKPNLALLYKKTKDQYMANTVIEAMRDFEIEY